MDALTHVVIGASVAQLPVSSQKTGLSFKQKALVGAAAALFPDIDFVLFLLNPLEFLAYWHRAETHSIVLLPLWALLLTLGWRQLKNMKKHEFELYWINFTALLSHTIVDSLTMYGTQWLAPFSNHKFSMNLLFVVDGYFTICALLVLSVLFIQQKSSLRWLVVLVPIAYLSLVYQIKHQAYQKLVAADQITDLNSSPILLPQPFSPYYWQLIDRNHDEINQAYLRLNDDPVASTISTLLGKRLQQDQYPLPDHLKWRHFSLYPGNSTWRRQAEEVWNHESFTAFRKFAKFPVLHKIENDNQHTCIWFSDLRYHWPNAIPQFRFGMCKDNVRDWKLYRKKYFSHQAVKIPVA